LSLARLYGGLTFERKHVDDLDTTCPVDRFRVRWRAAVIAATGDKSLA
jgi:hypothetical protein